jgi:hypothetical protein
MLIKNVFTLMWLGFIVPINAIHAEIPVAVLTKTSSACAIASNGNANPLLLLKFLGGKLLILDLTIILEDTTLLQKTGNFYTR